MRSEGAAAVRKLLPSRKRPIPGTGPAEQRSPKMVGWIEENDAYFERGDGAELSWKTRQALSGKYRASKSS